MFVTVPAEELVGVFRRRHHPRAVARRLPPHVTVLPPFTRDVDDDDRLVASLAEHFAALAPFTAELARVGTFKRHVWLGPEPEAEFAALLGATRSRFPQLVRDADREPVPHLTIAEIGKGESTRAVAQIAEDELAPHLPFSFTVRDVGLWEVRPEGWYELGGFELG